MGADDLHTATSQQEVLDFGNSLLTRDQECPIESAETLPTNDLPRHDHAHEYNSRTAPPNLELSAILRNALDKEGKFTRDQVFVSDTQILWNASVVLMAHWRAANVSFADETVLEMGSGLGHLAFSLATEHQCAKIVATDQAKHLHLLENSVKEQVGNLGMGAMKRMEGRSSTSMVGLGFCVYGGILRLLWFYVYGGSTSELKRMVGFYVYGLRTGFGSRSRSKFHVHG